MEIANVPTSARATCKQWNHGLRRQILVETLLKEIVNGQIRSGEHLVTQALARRFGVSHTPVREALVMLAGMGLLDVTPNRGAIVRKVTERGVREICQVRSALECEAVRLACGRIDGGIARTLEDGFAAVDRSGNSPIGVNSSLRPVPWTAGFTT